VILLNIFSQLVIKIKSSQKINFVSPELIFYCNCRNFFKVTIANKHTPASLASSASYLL
jgi:hypothetical protein